MSNKSKIEWTNTQNFDGSVTSGATWNPISGCSKVSAGCANCYAIRDAVRLSGNPNPKIADKYKGTTKTENGIKIEGVRDFLRQRNKLDRMCEHFGAKIITSFTDDDLRRYVRYRRENDQVKTATINRDFALLKTIFKRLAKQIGKHFEIPEFPINPQAETERSRVLTLPEEARLLRVCTEKEIITVNRRGKPFSMTIDTKREHLKPIIITAVDTAMRQGELMKLVWTDIDFESETITVQFFNSKTQKARAVGMTPRVKSD